MFNVQLYLEEALLAEIEYQKFVVQSNLKVSRLSISEAEHVLHSRVRKKFLHLDRSPDLSKSIFLHSRLGTCQTQVIYIVSKLKNFWTYTQKWFIFWKSDVVISVLECRTFCLFLSKFKWSNLCSPYCFIVEAGTHGQLPFNLQKSKKCRSSTSAG